MMRQMREATKPIMISTALAFVALMVFQWGMDITGRSSGRAGEIGKVNGTPVMYNDYMSAYRNMYEQAQKSSESPITSEQNKQIEDAAFNQVVNQILIQQELHRRGISVTNQEIQDAAKYDPPADVRAQFTDSTGHFDLQAWQTTLAQLSQEQLLSLESYYRDVIPRGKLLRQVSSGIYPPDGELWNRWKDAHAKVEIRYIPFDPSTSIPDDSVKVSDEDVQAYYQSHQDDFKVPAKATVKAVVLSKTPTPADTAASLDKARAVLDSIRSGTSFAEMAQHESSDSASAAQGGSLGVIARGQAPAPLDSAIFSARLDRATGPVKTGYGYHIIEVSKRWGADSARVSHILIPIARTDSSELALLDEADSLEALGAKMPLSEAASNLGLDVETADITSTLPYLQGAGQIGEGADWAFQDAAPGDVSPVFENAQAFYSLELVSSQPAGVLPLDQAKSSILQTLRMQKKMKMAEAEAQKVVDMVKGGEPLAKVASNLHLEMRHAGPFTQDDFVPGIGRQNAAIGAAFALQPGQVSGVVTTSSNVYVIENIDRIPADSTAWLNQKQQQRQTFISTEQQQRLQQWITALRASANIVDRREQVLKPADSDADQQTPTSSGPYGMPRTR